MLSGARGSSGAAASPASIQLASRLGKPPSWIQKLCPASLRSRKSIALVIVGPARRVALPAGMESGRQEIAVAAPVPAEERAERGSVLPTSRQRSSSSVEFQRAAGDDDPAAR